jgi:hypothetical protein
VLHAVMEACCCSRLPPVFVAPVAAAGDRRSAISSSSSSTGYGGGRPRHFLRMWAGLSWTYGPGSFHGSRLRVARTASSSKRAEMGCLSFEIRSAMLAKIQSGSASPSCVAATASECLKSFVQGMESLCQECLAERFDVQFGCSACHVTCCCDM